MRRKSKQALLLPGVASQSILRSINVRMDAEVPERIAHFHPTTKSVNLLKCLLGQEAQRAFFVVAPYGSGKSLTCAYLLHLVENRFESKDVLRAISTRMERVSPQLAELSAQRSRKNDHRGLVLVLEGYCANVAQSLCEAAAASFQRLGLRAASTQLHALGKKTTDPLESLTKLKELAEAAKVDRVAIIWDEFGRHLESLVAQGKPNELADLQVVAEFIARNRKTPFTLGLLLHQGLLHYGGNLPQAVRSEWSKIEGRFESISYVDDSKEIYSLLSEVVLFNRPKDKTLSAKDADRIAQECRDSGLFSEYGKAELSALLQCAYPIEPATLYLLPRVSARVAQNERTLFTFVAGADFSRRVGVHALYDYFATNMRTDTSVGGTYRQWLETESALSKVAEDSVEARVLKAACLLGLGVSGHRARTGLTMLELAVRGYGEGEASSQAIRGLIERKLLLHRQHSDDVAIWHGTDVDLRGRLEEKKQELRSRFDLIRFLTEEAKLPSWRPTDYNDEFGLCRFLKAEYQRVRERAQKEATLFTSDQVEVGSDGKVVYLIPEDQADLSVARELVTGKDAPARIVFAVPREPFGVAEVALEVWALTHMEQDAELIASDPLVSAELKQMADDARGHLQQLVGRLVNPDVKGPRWFHQGKELKGTSARELRRSLSDAMREIFPRTPNISNELIVRHRPTPQLVNARKKLTMAVLERCGQESLGLSGDTPDASMFRTVLLRTGLYRQNSSGRWAFAAPNELKDAGLKDVWGKLQKFLSTPSETGKSFRSLLDELKEPPIGVRAGLIPIFVAAALKAFPNAYSLTKNGTYVADILPSVIEDICHFPDQYRLSVLDLDADKLTYLRGVHRLFSPVSSYEVAEDDLIRLCFDAIEGWKAQLPPAALTTGTLSTGAKKVQRFLQSPPDPVSLLFRYIPEACEQALDNPFGLLTKLQALRDELVGVSKHYANLAKAAILKSLSATELGIDANLRRVASDWASSFPESFVKSFSEGVSKGLLTRMLMDYESEELLIASLASLLVGKGVTRWDDSTVHRFEQELVTTIAKIEEAALEDGSVRQGDAPNRLAKLLQARIMEPYRKLVSLVGAEAAHEFLASMKAPGKRS